MAKKSKRVKPDKSLIRVLNWQHADELLRELGDHQLKIQAAEAAAKTDIDAANAAKTIACKPNQDEIKLIACSLEAFAATHRDDFGDKKTKALDHGSIGWRLSKSVSIKKDKTLELIKQVFKGRKAKQFIHVKETPDKDALAKLTDEQLAAVKARRVVKDDFFVEPNIPEAIDYGDTK